MRQFAFMSALALVLLPGFALADCGGKTFISCDTGNGRHLEVCIEPAASPGDGAFTYRFGPGNKPELILREDFSAGTVTPWSGVGRAIWESVTFRNAGHVYEVWHSFDRLEQDAPLEGGVDILRDEVPVTSLSCKPGAVIAPLFTLEDTMTAAGYCHDRARREWRRDGCG